MGITHQHRVAATSIYRNPVYGIKSGLVPFYGIEII